MNKFTIVLIVVWLSIIATVVNAVDDNNSTSDVSVVEKQLAESDSVLNSTDLTEVEEGRVRVGHHHGLYPFYGGLLGFGGLHALAVLYAIKVKIIVVAFIVGLGIYYYSKFYRGGACFDNIIPYEGYSKNAPTFTSYNGPDPYSAYSNIRPDISSFDSHHDHHHSSGYGDSHPTFEGSSPYDSRDAGGSSPSGFPMTATSYGTPSGFDASPPTSAPHRRSARQVNNLSSLENINWGEIAFQFLGVDSDGCRRRFTCELDFRAQRNPFTKMAFGLIGSAFFDKYRDASVTPQTYSDCAKMYTECSAANKYNNANEVEEESVTETAENDIENDAEAEDISRSFDALSLLGQSILNRS